MSGKREKPEDIVMKLRQVEVLQGQGMSVAEAVPQIGVAPVLSNTTPPLPPAWILTVDEYKKFTADVLTY